MMLYRFFIDKNKRRKKTEYDEQAERFLSLHGIRFEAEYISKECPPWCVDKDKPVKHEQHALAETEHCHGYKYRILFERDGKIMQLYFWNSYADVTERACKQCGTYDGALDNMLVRVPPKYALKPNAYTVIACLAKSHPGTRAEFCSDFGYDIDSISHRDLYYRVLDEWSKVSGFFSAEEIEEMQEIY